MWLDLRDCLDVPGSSKSFSTTLDGERLRTPSVFSFVAPPAAEGTVSNTAGLLTLRGIIHADMRCVCDRCGREFPYEKNQRVELPLARSPEDAENPDLFPLDGEGIEVSEALESCFLLDLETKLLCRKDCKGLCPHCGKNLNDGPCTCPQEKDPRFAVLEQLLENP